MAEEQNASRFRARKPLGVLVALAAEIGDALAAQKGEVALHASVHRAEGEVAPSLAVLLAVEDVGAECCGIEVGGDGGKSFDGNRRGHDGTFAAVKGLPQGEVIDVIKLHASLDEHPNDLREGLFGMKRGMDGGGDKLGVHEGMSVEADLRAGYAAQGSDPRGEVSWTWNSEL